MLLGVLVLPFFKGEYCCLLIPIICYQSQDFFGGGLGLCGLRYAGNRGLRSGLCWRYGGDIKSRLCSTGC